ncbi:hypothetical protein Pcinc_005247 [Petrolisthes cinctipes]|uniref:Rap-GAP domain-containing protein n=1 Tax=Petrolisthes cinctipes TaxID=88211 RepID=A0AAE1GFH2_PETCI|nr:hypothetical protein Pcinc_005247 [Petrolisthes cinctipes]
MFKKSATSSDVKKSLLKCLDNKKDTPTRLKHLRTVLDNTDAGELKAFLEANFSPVFHIFYEAFITFEGNLKQKGTFAVQKSHKEDLECSLYVLDRLLCLLPERFEKRWQCNALTHIFKKILHPGNIVRLRRDAMRLFVIWYTLVGDSKTPEMDRMFASLVPGFPTPPPAAVPADLGHGGVTCLEPSPVIPPSSTEKTPPDDLSSYFLRSLLDYMVTQVRRVEWQDKNQQTRTFSYLFNMFRMWYMPHIFPSFNSANSLYKPNLELPELRSSPGPSLYGTCQVAVVEWVRKFVVSTSQRSGQSVSSAGEEDGRRSGHSDAPEATTSDQDSITSAFYVNEENGSGEEGVLVREMLFSSRDNVNFIHELFRQSLCLSFRYAAIMKTVIFTYKDWIQMNTPEMPPFMLEPVEGGGVGVREEAASPQDNTSAQRRLRNESYLGALNRDIHIRAGLQNVVQVFITSAANVFLLEVSPDYPRLLDEQVEVCKHVLNIYRYMVMNTRMEQKTWEQLLVVLLHVTSQTLCGRPTTHKEDSLGGRFASALFQTLIVSWIKANLSVSISGDLWDQLLLTLSSLTHWDELIKEWAKTLDTLTRVLARHVYGLELNSLPLERITERRLIKRGTKLMSGLDSARNSFARNWSSVRLDRHNGNTPDSHTPTQPPTLSHLQEESHTDNASSHGSSERSPFSRKRRGSAGGGSLKAGANGSSPKLSPHHPSDDHRTHQHSHQQHTHQHVHQHPHKRLARSLSESSLVVRRSGRSRSIHGDCEGHLNGHHQYLHNTRSKSLHTLSHGYGDDDSRTPSPSPSSGVESSSMKDSPMQIELGGDTTSIDTLEGGLSSEQRSVMSGGAVRGWLPDVAVVLWRRVLGLLGDPNQVASPAIHAQIFKYLSDLTDTLVKLRNNQSISVDNQSSPEPPELIPPLPLVAPWCFRALSLPSTHHKGKVLAYRLLCVTVVRRHDIQPSREPSRDILTNFYRVLHQGLVGQDQEVINTLVAECGPGFFSLGLPGSTMLTLDFIYATNTVITSPDTKMVSPKLEALSLLGSLLPLSSLYPSMPVLQPSASGLALMTCSDVKDHLVTVLLKSGKRDGWWRTRSLALCTLALYLYHELAHQTFHTKVNEAFNVLLASLKQPASPPHLAKHLAHTIEIGRLVGQVAADLLLLLCDHADALLTHYPDIPTRIILVLCQTLGGMGTDNSLTSSSEGKHLVLSCLFCLAEWVMRTPQHVLIQPAPNDKKPLLQHVFKVLHVIANGKKNTHFKSPNLEVSDFDLHVREDGGRNGNNGDGTNNSRGDSLKRSTFPSSPSCPSTIRLAARSITSHIMNHLWHFPLGVGAQRLSSLVVEGDDVPGLTGDELSSEVFLSPHVQLFTLNRSCLLSVVQLPALQVPGGASTVGFKTPSSEVRLILRDLSGKFSWDSSLLYAPPADCTHHDQPPTPHHPHPHHHHLHHHHLSQTQTPLTPQAQQQTGLPSSGGLSSPNQTGGGGVGVVGGVDGGRDETLMTSSLVVTSPPRHTLRHRPPGTLPTHEDSADDLDNLDDLLNYVGHTSPEVLEQFGHALNEAVGPPPSLPLEAQHDAISTILNQRNMEADFQTRHAVDANMVCPGCHCPTPIESRSPFQQGRLLFDQLGLASWEKRQSIYTLKKNDKLLRELKNLDNQKCRETHKLAVIYVAEGQEDKMSILSNSGGSAGFEEFVGGLGWEVELATHTGFLGGLQRNGSTGETAPYYATSLTEVVFHVSTRMPSFSEQSMLQKTRHLGNDEVHIVWSEHTRDYRRGIIPTEFCDVLIVIYPLPNRLYRIQISTKPDVPFFGPLFDGALVGHKVLPGLVRATAINASRAKRSRLTLYQNFYEERARALDTIIEQYSEATTFESFISSVYCPVFPTTFTSGPTRASGTSFSSRVFDSSLGGVSGLAAALLDGPQLPPGPPQRPPLTRPTSYSTGEQHHLREKARSVLLMEHTHTSEDSGGGAASSGSSPRGNKKLSFKNPRNKTTTGAPPTTPPESPMPPPRRAKDRDSHHHHHHTSSTNTNTNQRSK